MCCLKSMVTAVSTGVLDCDLEQLWLHAMVTGLARLKQLVCPARALEGQRRVLR